MTVRVARNKVSHAYSVFSIIGSSAVCQSLQ